MDSAATFKFISEQWDKSIVPELEQYIRIPNQSPAYDPQWASNGLIDKAAEHMVRWVKEQNVPGLNVQIIKAEKRTPIIFIEVEASPDPTESTVLMYGHLDKQPPLLPWSEGLGPYDPVIRDGKLYGRGGADDGYAIYASLTAIINLKKQNLPHARCLILIEACEESGSFDLPYYVELLAPRIRIPDLVICLDSGARNYKQMWLTTSLRGTMSGILTVKVVENGIHSGVASGIAPSSFRIIRHLLDRIENPVTGEILIPELHAPIPTDRVQQIKEAVSALGDEGIYKGEIKFAGNTQPISDDLEVLLTNRTWKPTLCVTGVEGIPPVDNAGNVLRTHTSLRLSIRLPPTIDALTAAAAVKAVLEKDPPYGATVSFDADKNGSGWNAPPLASWVENSFTQSSRTYFEDQPCGYVGEGGSIPLIGMLHSLFPNSQFCVTGVLGPGSNAHGPDEMIVIDYAKRINCCVSQVLYDHYLSVVKK